MSKQCPAAERQPISNYETYHSAYYSSTENGEVEGGVVLVRLSARQSAILCAVCLSRFRFRFGRGM